jgi:hypothetical protein
MTSTARLTITETDEIILAASTKKDGAIGDSEVSEEAVTYFFESGSVGTVSRVTGAVTIQEATTDASRTWYCFQVMALDKGNASAVSTCCSASRRPAHQWRCDCSR